MLEDEELEEESEEIKEILDHKTEKGKIKYLVKWKNDKLQNEWVDENNFDTVEIINEYYKKIHRKDQEETTSPIENKRGRKKINLKSNNLALTVIILYIFIGIIGSAVQIEEDNTFEIKGDYRYCEPTQRIISLDDNCIPRKDKEKPIGTVRKKYNGSEKPEFIILSKLTHEVSGSGYSCKREKIYVSDTMGFFGNKYEREITREMEILTRVECEIMALTKKCKEKEMKCIAEGSCEIEYIPPENYKWFGKQTTIGEKCTITAVNIEAETANDELQLTRSKKCFAKDEECIFGKNIIIWNKENTIHNCAFAVNMRSKLDWGIENVYYNEDERILFQVTEMTTQCPSKIEMYKTTEGLYLMVNKDLNEKQKEDVMKMKVKNTLNKTAY